MISVQVSTPSPDTAYPPTLADLSRNASVISTSSSDSVPPLRPVRPRPIRTFTSPRSSSPQPPPQRNSGPTAYLSRELGLPNNTEPQSTEQRVAAARARSNARSKSRNTSVNPSLTPEDFDFGEELGEGSYSSVVRGRRLATGKEYAVKILDKRHLSRKDKLPVALAEKNALVRLGGGANGHPGIVRLHFTFHDEYSLYFVLDLAPNGEMQTRISRLGSLSILCTRYYAAQIVDAVEYMHSKGVIHRDLKPENLLFDDAFRIKITDFGTGRYLEPGEERAMTFVGSPQYVAPELLESSETSRSSDLWALGCIIYQMIAGRFAFHGLSEYLTWQKIKQLDFSFPEGFDEQAKDLVNRLLIREPSERLGAGLPGSMNDMRALRSHPFFVAVDWTTLWTDPAPPLESGLVKKEDHPLADVNHQNWDDIGAAWDELVESNGVGQGSDEMDWASDAERPAYQRIRQNGYGRIAQEIGPMGEIPRYASNLVDEDAITISGDSSGDVGANSKTFDVPSRPSQTNASGSSSSDGSPTEKLGAAMEEMALGRGRPRVPTPIQGNISDTDLSALLLPGEIIIYSSRVESRTLRRRASLLRTLTVTPMKPKFRQLILTSHRILAIKTQKGRTGTRITVKVEVMLRPADRKDKDKETHTILISAEPKSEREFVLLTSAKSHTYATETPAMASNWIKNINDVSKDTPTLLNGHTTLPTPS